jgi:hypothetical protein
VRIARLVVLGLLIAAVLSAVALAVDKQGAEHAKTTKSDDAAEVTVTVNGVLHKTADGYFVGSRAVSFGPPWYAAGSPLVKDNLGKTVTVTGVADDDDLSVRTINGTVYRAKGRPPWAGGPKHTSSTAASACKAKAKSAAKAAKDAGKDEKSTEKTDKPGSGPPPWAKAYGHRCKV